MSADPITDSQLVGEFFGADSEPDYDSAPQLGITEHKAAEYLRIVGDIDAQRARLERFAKEEIAIITDRLAQRVETFEKAKRWHLAPLEEFARREVAANPGGKTIDLLCGQLKLTAPGKDGKLVVTDKVAFESWAALATVPTDVPGVRVQFVPDAKVLKGTAPFSLVPVDDDPDAFEIALEGGTIPGIRRVITTDDTFSYSVTAR